ncbi:MAG: beta galactosidase jelly roll domain-containing protein [Candidatus Hydrogenedentes bacterium]|nr:beta galactosidase jelly roll domain-containing protein [Candidatus Hydrogenedentota bacterium]
MRDNWKLQSSAVATAPGEAISVDVFSADGWYPTSVPSTLLAALVANGVYPDPFLGDNSTKIPGYQKGVVIPEDSPFYPSWWYRTSFEIPASWTGKRLTLHLDGINYRANVWVNGRQLADGQSVVGMFRRFTFDATDALHTSAKNVLALEITGPGHVPKKPYRTKQIEATTGWDDHNPQPPDLNTGVWRDVYVAATGPVLLRDPYVASKLDVPSLAKADLTLSARAVNLSDAPAKAIVKAAIESIAVEQKVELAAGETREVIFAPEQFAALRVEKPRVWWPNDLGAQELYSAKWTVSVAGQESDATDTRFGIREATTYINEEGWRGYRVNGRNVLIRGGAWMTSDMLLRLTRGRYDALIRYAREGHLNMLRSEGFSIRETEDFYDLCDQYGIMVTQQLFGRSIPDEPLAISCVEDTLLRIRNHPSLVHFLGHDETFPTKTLDAAYRDLLERLTPDRTYQPHSGAFDVKERFETGGTRTGSLLVWTYATPAHYYQSKETGAWGFAQSGGIGGIVAPMESIRRMMPGDELWPLWTKAESLHTVAQGGTYYGPVVKAVSDRYGEPDGIEAFVRKVEALNYESARGMFEAYARNKYSATGITTWKYDAAWPAMLTWQYVDWYLLATAGYYGAKKACEPLHIQYSYDDASVWVVNTRGDSAKGLNATACIHDLDGKELGRQSATLDVGPDGKTQAFVLDAPANIPPAYFVRLTLNASDGVLVSDNFYWLSNVRDVTGPVETPFLRAKSTADFTTLNGLRPTAVHAVLKLSGERPEEAAEVNIDNPGDAPAFLIRLAIRPDAKGAEIAPAYWEDNYITLLPHASRTLRVRFAAPAGFDPASAVVTAKGWNTP